ncbi:hypothetical protein M758_4G175300 [Ceratodon purpureus]|nr:hypothetical protein M758_4G175300 [Ceratodon purpureus]
MIITTILPVWILWENFVCLIITDRREIVLNGMIEVLSEGVLKSLKTLLGNQCCIVGTL